MSSHGGDILTSQLWIRLKNLVTRVSSTVITVGVEHSGAAVAAIEDMEGMAGQMAARDTRHRGGNMLNCGTMQLKSSLVS